MTAAVSLVSIVVFLIALWRFRLVHVVGESISVAQHAVSILRSSELSEQEKEVVARTSALRLLRVCGSILLRAAGILLAAWLPIQVGHALAIVDREAVIAFILRWDVIVSVSAAIFLGLLIGRRLGARY